MLSRMSTDYSQVSQVRQQIFIVIVLSSDIKRALTHYFSYCVLWPALRARTDVGNSVVNIVARQEGVIWTV